ncbi:MAG TPA: spore cortex biosynthesis protein YabQ, partial [Firmicutes bacterium]|nr:spore cortex biosynthesis protein YabQ [Bacillota bacterium]
MSIQIANFLMTIFCGLLIGGLFDGYRVVRGILTPKTLFTGIGDLIFWVVSTLVVFATLLLTNC